LRVHYEVKSNLRRQHVRALAAAGVVHVQPGIESLSTRVLDIMDKGVDGVTNVRLLRDCEDFCVTTPWNLLYGFPGEDPDDYRAIVQQIPNLFHLQPPRIATRIALERFSPYHQRGELGFAMRRPAAFYDHVYDLPVDELMDLVFVFDCHDRGIEGELEESVLQAVASWQDAYVSSSLTYERTNAELIIIDRRVGRAPRELVLCEPWQVAGYEVLLDGHGPRSLSRALARQGFACDPSVIEPWLDVLVDEGFAFHDAGRFVALATRGVPTKVPVERWR